MIFIMLADENLIKILKNNGVAVIPTDTVYGLVGSALSLPVVNRIYSLRRRNPEKPCIILIGEPEEIKKFSIILSTEQGKKIGEYWPGAVSIVFDCEDENFSYLYRGTKTLAFRIPAQEKLRDMLTETGPLIAPSANPEGLPVAQNITEAEAYFGDSVDLYIDGGELTGKASKVIKLHKDGSVSILRE
ncbi:MAG TPA: L-threonylcarbamoyladenylate synthase [Candidatus Paceibacterota bacterium]